MACEIDESALPLLPAGQCPTSTEWVVVGNAQGGLDANGGFTVGYARRYWKDLIPCILAGLTFGYQQFIVPATGLPVGQSTIRINQTNVLQDSVQVVLDGGVLDRNDSTQVSYTVSYDANGFTVTLNQAAANLQTYVIVYAHY